jgi:hypothetical protein
MRFTETASICDTSRAPVPPTQYAAQLHTWHGSNRAVSKVLTVGMAALLLLCARASLAAGWQGSGAELENLCTAPESTFDSGACAGYVLSIADILRDAP